MVEELETEGVAESAAAGVLSFLVKQLLGAKAVRSEEIPNSHLLALRHLGTQKEKHCEFARVMPVVCSLKPRKLSSCASIFWCALKSAVYRYGIRHWQKVEHHLLDMPDGFCNNLLMMVLSSFFFCTFIHSVHGLKSFQF